MSATARRRRPGRRDPCGGARRRTPPPWPGPGGSPVHVAAGPRAPPGVDRRHRRHGVVLGRQHRRRSTRPRPTSTPPRHRCYDNAAVIALQRPDLRHRHPGRPDRVPTSAASATSTMALMGMFLVGRHTRADEEAGRTELVRATVVGRNAPVTAALLVTSAALDACGVLIALAMLTPGPRRRRVGGVRRGDGRLRRLLRRRDRGGRPGHRAQPHGLRPDRRGAGRCRTSLRAVGDVGSGGAVVAVAHGLGAVGAALRGRALVAAGAAGRRHAGAAGVWPTGCCRGATSAAGWSRPDRARRSPRAWLGRRGGWRCGCSGAPDRRGWSGLALGGRRPTARWARTWATSWATASTSRTSSPRPAGA